MDHLHYTANEHRKGQHLTFECRVLIQTRLKDGWSPNRIAKEIGCAPNTVRNEIKRGTVSLYKGNILRYKATAGQDAYERNRQSCCRHYDFFEKSNFISFVEQKFFEEGWSLDACVGRALKNELFTRDQIVCTKTLSVLYYIFEHDNPIDDGQTIAGLENGDMNPDIKWKVQYEDSLIQPVRTVIDINMGEYASGTR